MHVTDDFASSLFFEGNCGIALPRIEALLAPALAELHLPAQPVLRTDTDLTLNMHGVRVSVTLSPDPLDLRPFNGASSPCAAFGLSPLKQRMLVRHRSAIAVRVALGQSQAKPETLLVLCYIATCALVPDLRPDLVHWARSNRVYSYDEFAHRTFDQHAPRMSRAEAPGDAPLLGAPTDADCVACVGPGEKLLAVEDLRTAPRPSDALARPWLHRLWRGVQWRGVLDR